MGGADMSKFKDALERGKKARRVQEQQPRKKGAERDEAATDFKVRARTWLKNIIVRTLEAAKAEVAGEVTINIDTALLDTDRTTPTVRFQIYRMPKSGEKQLAPRTFTVTVDVEGGVLVSAPGMVARDAGVIVDKSAERFTTLVAELIEDAAKGT